MFDGFKPPPSPFEAPALPYRIISSPIRLLAQLLYSFQLYFRDRPTIQSPEEDQIRILCISDTHCNKPTSLPPADLLIHAGDLTNNGTVEEIQEQVDWLAGLDYKYKIVVAGNHDSFFDPRSRRQQDRGKEISWGSETNGLHYLQHSSVTLRFSGRELKIFGAPQIPACGGPDFAFQHERGQDAWSHMLPEDMDILVTHTPPRHHLDLPRGMGCSWLLKELWRVNFKPRLHVFGHVHLGYGVEHACWNRAQRTYERLCDRKEDGIIQDVFDIFAWINLAKLFAYVFLGLGLTRIWGGDVKSTIMVNAALMVGSTGKLRDEYQLVEI